MSEGLELLVQRVCLFNKTADEALQVLRDNLDEQIFGEIYTKEKMDWEKTADTNPLARFPLNDGDRQDVFFREVEDLCRGAYEIQDYPAYVPLILHSAYVLTTARQARPCGFHCVYGRARYRLAWTLISCRVPPWSPNRPVGISPDVRISLLAFPPFP